MTLTKLAKLVFAAFLITIGAALPARAQPFSETFVSNTGLDTHNCGTVAQACASFAQAIQETAAGGQITVLNSGDYGFVNIAHSLSVVGADGGGTPVDVMPANTGCGGQCALINIETGPSDVVTLRGLVINGTNVPNFVPVQINNAARVNIENCLLLNGNPASLLIHPFVVGNTLATDFSVTIQDTTMNGGATGLKVTPVPGVNISVGITRSHFDNNTGGGIRIDTSGGGTATTTISDSSIGFNGGNGINAVAGANQNVISIKNSVIARNSAAGVQANGATAGVLVQTTLFDQNVGGATSVVNSGHISTYGNNSIIGSAGSGFTGSAALQ
jgi:hypothetical protein